MKKYYILMGDIIGSRKQNQKELWEKFNTIIQEANAHFEKQRLSQLSIKLGDDFQVIMNDIKSLLELMYYLDIAFKHVSIECRFAIGYGSIQGEISKDSIYNLMGEGLTYTHTLLNDKNIKTKYRFFVQDDKKLELALNVIGLLLEEVTKKQTNKREEFLYHLVVRGLNLEQLMDELNIKERNVYKYKEDTKYNLIQEVFLHIEELYR